MNWYVHLTWRRWCTSLAGMAKAPAQRTNRRVVYEKLRRKMLTLELPPGAALSENELAAELGVSRTPIREGLILLSEEGLVQVFPQVGSFVSRVNPDRVADAQFLREAVELASLDDIPAEPDAAVVAELQANLEEQHVPGIDLEDFFALDEEFHRGLLQTGRARAGLADRGSGQGPPGPGPPAGPACLVVIDGKVRRSTRRRAARGAFGRPGQRERHDAATPAGRVRRHRADPQPLPRALRDFRFRAGQAQRRGVGVVKRWISERHDT